MPTTDNNLVTYATDTHMGEYEMKMDPGYVIIDAALFVDVYEAGTSSEETRYYLQGVHVRPGRYPVIEATDGHLLLAGDSPLNHSVGGAGFIVKPDKPTLATVKKQITAYRKKPHHDLAIYVERDGDGDCLYLIAYEHDQDDPCVSIRDAAAKGVKSPNVLAAQGGVLIDGTYPDTSKVWPDTLPTGMCGQDALRINPALLMRLARLSPRKDGGVWMHQHDAGDPIVTLIDGRDDLIALVMPQRPQAQDRPISGAIHERIKDDLTEK